MKELVTLAQARPGEITYATGPDVSAGKLRALAVTSRQRSDILKDVPTVAESGFQGLEMISWFGTVVRAGSPIEGIARLNAEILRALEITEVKNALAKVGLTAAGMKPDEFSQFIRSEMQRYDKTVKEAKLKVD
jgi:tripartite-type tricarboxylate transporter receptor subunit TctC